MITPQQFKKAAGLLRKAYAELEDEAIKEGLNIVSPAYDKLTLIVREKILSEMGISDSDYEEAKSNLLEEKKKTSPSLENILNEGVMKTLDDVKKTVEENNSKVNEFTKIHIPTSDEIAKIARTVAQEYVKPPQITNQIIKETTIEKPQIIKETIVEKVVEEKNYNEKPMMEKIDSLSLEIQRVSQGIDKETILTELINTMTPAFGKMFQDNINILGMPDFRKLAMGMQGQIDERLVKNILAGTNVTITNSKGVYTISSVGGSGGGDVSGGSSSTDNAIAIYNGTTGKIIKNSAWIVDPSTGALNAGAGQGSLSSDLATINLWDSANGVTSPLAFSDSVLSWLLDMSIAGNFTVGSIQVTTSAQFGSPTNTINNSQVTNATLSLNGYNTLGGSAQSVIQIQNVTSGAPKLGFNAATPIAKPSGDVATALSNLGLITSPTVIATTNANLTGVITSVGNATSIASQTGTGSKFVVDTSPTLVTPVLGVATATSINGSIVPSSDTLIGRATTDTLTNKRITRRVTTATDATSITPNTDNADETRQTNTQALGTLTINADAGTPTDGQGWVIVIKSTNVQTFSWNSIFLGGTVALPTATTGSSKMDMYSFKYSTINSKWNFIGNALGF